MKRYQGIVDLVITCCLTMVVGLTFCLNGSTWAMEKKMAHPFEANNEKRETIRYAGQLTNASGNPVADGSYHFVFTLYDTETGGSALWSETRQNLLVKGGELLAALGGGTPLPRGLTSSPALYLEIKVQGTGEAGYTTLSPRQKLNPALVGSPIGALQCPHSHFGDGWFGNSSSMGLSVNNSGTGDGIQASTNSTYYNYAAIYAVNTSTGSGIFGSSTGGAGIFGSSTGGDGVYGESYINSTDRAGVHGTYNGSDGGVGVIGETGSTNIYSTGVYAKYNASTGDGRALYAFAASPDAWGGIFNSYAGNGVKIFAGTGKIGLSVSGGSKNAVVRTKEGHRLLYTEESTGVWFTDYGFGRLKNGQAVIPIDPVFAQTVNLNESYHVFVQSYGKTELFVSERTPTHFRVSSAKGNKAADFSYRIVAKRLGFEQARLESAPWADKDRALSLENQAGEKSDPTDKLVLNQRGEK